MISDRFRLCTRDEVVKSPLFKQIEKKHEKHFWMEFYTPNILETFGYFESIVLIGPVIGAFTAAVFFQHHWIWFIGLGYLMLANHVLTRMRRNYIALEKLLNGEFGVFEVSRNGGTHANIE